MTETTYRANGERVTVPDTRPPNDDITLGEVGRRVDDVKGAIAQLRTDLSTNYIPRAELELRFATVDKQIAEVDRGVNEAKTEIDAHRRESVAARRAVTTGLTYPLIVGVLLVAVSALVTVLVTG